MPKTTYNGWTNYETWNVALWMDNEQGSYEDVREQAREALACHDDNDDKEDAAHSLALILKDQYEDAMADVLERAGASSTVWADLLGAALSEVNWHEIAGNLIDEMAEV